MNIFCREDLNWIICAKNMALNLTKILQKPYRGLLFNQHEKIPKLKERIIIGDYEFEILHVSDTRIEMVRIKILK